MVSSITLETEHVMLTSFRVRTRTRGHEYELGKDVLVSKSRSDYNPSQTFHAKHTNLIILNT
jgi:hypothetical protein